MKRFGRIEDGRVTEIITAEALPPFYPEVAAKFQELPEGIEEHWVYEEGGFTPPPPPPAEITSEETPGIASAISTINALDIDASIKIAFTSVLQALENSERSLTRG